MEYQIKYFEDQLDWNITETASVSCYPWDENGYRPATYAKLCYVKSKGLYARLWCYEENPRIINSAPDSPVSKDSCVEFFMQLEAHRDKGYLNFEMNSTGTLLCQFGKNRTERQFIKDLGYSSPNTLPFHGIENNTQFWGIELAIPYALLHEAYGVSSLYRGVKLKGNFYKCGDDTEKPHYGCWSPITNASPDFHLPEYFGDMIIV